MRQHVEKNDRNYTQRARQPDSMIKTWQASQQLIHQRDTHISSETEKLPVCGRSALRNRQLFPFQLIFMCLLPFTNRV